MGLKKQIIQFKDGKQVAVYNSATEAAKAIGVSNDKIYKNCGKNKQVNGFIFQYNGEVTNRVERNSHGEYKCPYCEDRFESYNSLCKHVIRNKKHGEVSKEQLLVDFKYNGIRPTCKCGCGEYTEISYNGEAHFRDYVIGHHNRVHNNWGHNPKAIERSAETRRKQYASGERVQWNKGKKWKELFTEEKIEELMKTYSNKERNKKISERFKGVPKSEEHAEKCRQNGRSETSILANREKMMKLLSSGKFKISSMIEEEFVESCIVPLGIEFKTQYYLKDMHHYCDVYIPSQNTIIEFQGDYWHGNPKKYLREELSPYQLDKVKKDEMLREYCKNKGITLIEVWESEYNKDKDGIRGIIKSKIMLT